MFASTPPEKIKYLPATSIVSAPTASIDSITLNVNDRGLTSTTAVSSTFTSASIKLEQITRFVFALYSVTLP
jgi:hypothetical protein